MTCDKILESEDNANWAEQRNLLDTIGEQKWEWLSGRSMYEALATQIVDESSRTSSTLSDGANDLAILATWMSCLAIASANRGLFSEDADPEPNHSMLNPHWAMTAAVTGVIKQSI